MNLANSLAAAEIVSADKAIAVTVDVLGAAIDVRDYDGVIKLCLIQNNIAGTTPTLDVNVVESEATGGTYTSLSGGAFAQKVTTDDASWIDVDVAQTKGFLKFNYNIEGTSSPQYLVSTFIVGVKKYRK